MVEAAAVCEAFASPTSTSRCNKPASGIMTTVNPESDSNRTINWSICSKTCAESLRSDLEDIGMVVEEVSV